MPGNQYRKGHWNPVEYLGGDSKARAAVVRLAEHLVEMASEKNRY